MKNITSILLTTILIFTFSCSNDSNQAQSNPMDESKYLDQDPDCNQIKTNGTCCDTDGRILVEAGKSYKYTYKANFKLDDVKWTVLSGSIILVEGQDTGEVTFYFANDFTKGTISGYGTGDGLRCQSTIEISKL